MNCAVLGAGSWGTALALQLARTNDQVRLWDHNADRAQQMQQARENTRYLPDIRFPDPLTVSGDMEWALDGAQVVLEVVPSQTVRGVMAAAAPFVSDQAVICCASKGVETGTLMTMNEVLEEVLPPSYHQRLTFLAGPSFAKEVARGLPTAVVVAGHHQAPADMVSEALHGGAMRAYYTTDVIGAELGGALKNVIAIACGVADGMGAGLNARAALITRGLAEITRMAVARGANPMTLSGLAGMGDLVLTCTGDLSRNRRVGLGLGKGKQLEEILEELGQVAEGVITTKSSRELAMREGIEMPISEEIYQMLYQDKPVAAALMALMGRSRKAERDDER